MCHLQSQHIGFSKGIFCSASISMRTDQTIVAQGSSVLHVDAAAETQLNLICLQN